MWHWNSAPEMCLLLCSDVRIQRPICHPLIDLFGGLRVFRYFSNNQQYLQFIRTCLGLKNCGSAPLRTRSLSWCVGRELATRERERERLWSDGEMTLGMINANPVVHAKRERVARSEDVHSEDALDALDVFESVRDIKDPEHPYSLEQLSVLSEESITVDEKLGRIRITFTPTVKHCSMATVIGLCLRVKLMQCFPPHFKVDINVSPGSLANEEEVNKQLNDKERVSAALENPSLRQLVDECLYSNELYSC